MTFPANVFAYTNLGEDKSNYSDDSFDPILDDLNESQAQAVTHPGGPLLVVAGAGSGKTRVLTRRIAYLIQRQNISPYEILAITFTNKAAAEMVERVSKVVGPVAAKMWVSTFHSACARILRMDGSSVGIMSGFSIYDVSDATRLVDYARRDLGADPKRFSAKSLHRTISSMKNELITPSIALERASMETETTIAKIYAEYENRLRAANAADFDDLLVKCVELLKTNDQVREKYQSRFVHVLVDEFQDTNLAQSELVNIISGKHKNITVVGDADQSIYKFRGADHLNMERFEKAYPDTHVVVLNTNYRSTENILNAANAVISNNVSRHKKELISNKGVGEPITVYYANSDRSEAQFVASTISKIIDGASLDSIAIFYRTNAQSRLLEEQLIRAGIAYRIIGGTKFYERKEIKDAMAYLRIFFNPADEASWRRIVNEPKRGIGDTSVAKITSLARMYDLTFREALERPSEIGLSKKAANAALGLCSIFDLAHSSEKVKVADILDHLLNASGYMKMLDDEGSFESQGRQENLIELLSQAREFDSAIDVKWREAKTQPTNAAQYNDGDFAKDDEQLLDPESAFDRVGAFLEAVSLLAESDQANANDEAVTLMTLHTAKGLEYSTVFITGLEEGLFPHERSLGDVSELEEERRLCYVGITRAMDRLYLSCALSRMMYATPDYFSPSRFLKEIPAELVKAIEDKEAPSDFMRPRSGGDSFSQTRKSRYSQVYDEVVFDDIDPNDETEFGSRSYGAKSRSHDFVTSKRVQSRIWGDSKGYADSDQEDEEDQPLEVLPLESDFDVAPFSVGVSVEHKKYGLGKVIQIEVHRNGDTAISVDFPLDRKRIFMASLNPPLRPLK